MLAGDSELTVKSVKQVVELLVLVLHYSAHQHFCVWVASQRHL